MWLANVVCGKCDSPSFLSMLYSLAMFFYFFLNLRKKVRCRSDHYQEHVDKYELSLCQNWSPFFDQWWKNSICSTLFNMPSDYLHNISGTNQWLPVSVCPRVLRTMSQRSFSTLKGSGVRVGMAGKLFVPMILTNWKRTALDSTASWTRRPGWNKNPDWKT